MDVNPYLRHWVEATPRVPLGRWHLRGVTSRVPQGRWRLQQARSCSLVQEVAPREEALQE